MSLRGHHKATTGTVQTASFLVVRFGRNICALPAQCVRGVLTCEEVGAGRSVTAVGVTYQALDVAGRFSASVDLTHPNARTVLYSNGQSHGAIRAEEVIGMVDAEREQCLPLPPHFREAERTWISGMLFFRDQLVLILNPEWVLGEIGEVAMVGGAAKALSSSMVLSKTC